jgi:hypothetical protein
VTDGENHERGYELRLGRPNRTTRKCRFLPQHRSERENKGTQWENEAEAEIQTAQTSRTQTGGERENLGREKQNGSAATRARNQTEVWRNPSASPKRATLPRDRKEKRERKILRRAWAGMARCGGNLAATAEPSRRQPKPITWNQNRVGWNKSKSDTETGSSRKRGENKQHIWDVKTVFSIEINMVISLKYRHHCHPSFIWLLEHKVYDSLSNPRNINKS